MARVSRAERDARNRAALIAAAEEVFTTRGIAGASLDEIADRADLTKGALYTRFSGKGDLILAVIEHRLRHDPDAHAFAAILTDTSLTADERFERWIDQWTAVFAGGSRARFARLLFEFLPYALTDPELRTRFAQTVGLAPPPVQLPAAEAAPPAADVQGEAAPASPIPPGSAFAALPADAQQRIVTALDIGLAFQSLIAPEHTNPELYGTALRLLTAAPTHPDGDGDA
jgi:AcrR family transcriptional regulator